MFLLLLLLGCYITIDENQLSRCISFCNINEGYDKIITKDDNVPVCVCDNGGSLRLEKDKGNIESPGMKEVPAIAY
jgi:hypothetical protein